MATARKRHDQRPAEAGRTLPWASERALHVPWFPSSRTTEDEGLWFAPPPPSLRVLKPQDANTLSEAPALGRVSVWTHMQRHLGAVGDLVLSYPWGMVQNRGGWRDGVRLAAARFGAAWERGSLDIQPSQCPGGGPAWPSTSTRGPGSEVPCAEPETLVSQCLRWASQGCLWV